LVIRPDSVAPFDPLARYGWNGPYLDSSGGHYLTDAWENAYLYEPVNRRIVSTGGASGDSLIVSF
jgi:hypothetical protein